MRDASQLELRIAKELGAHEFVSDQPSIEEWNVVADAVDSREWSELTIAAPLAAEVLFVQRLKRAQR